MNYARAVAFAQKLIGKNGRLVTMQRLDATAADADKPWKGPGVPTVAQSVDTKAVFLPHTGQDDLGKFLVDAELLKRAEQVVIVAAGTDDLEPFNQLSDTGVVWLIDWIRTLRPGDTSILYAIGLKR